MLSDIATSYERVADHCSNIAVYMIQVQDNQIEEHGLIEYLKDDENEHFEEQVAAFRKKYELP